MLARSPGARADLLYLAGHPRRIVCQPIPTLSFPHSGGYAGRPGYDSEGKAMSIRNAFWGKPTPHMVAFHLR